MRTLSTIAHLTSDAACAALYTLSIAISFGIVVAAATQRLGPTLLAALAALLLAGAGFGYSIWRTYAPPRRPRARKFHWLPLADPATR